MTDLDEPDMADHETDADLLAAAAAERGDEPEAARRAFATAYASLAARVDALLALPLEAMSPSELSEAAAHIHREAATA